MAKGLAYFEGLNELITELNDFGDDIELTIRKSLDETFTDIENKMKSNAKSSFNKGHAENVMINSISHDVAINEGQVIGSVGVFDMANKTGSMDRVIGKSYGMPRRITAPMLAMFYEVGIRPHSTSPMHRLEHSTGKKRVGNEDSAKMHKGSPPIPFMTSAFDASSASIFTDIEKKLTALIDKK